MEYRTLENTDSACIYEAFTQAFSDYQVSVDMPFKSFETMLKRNPSFRHLSRNLKQRPLSRWQGMSASLLRTAEKLAWM